MLLRGHAALSIEEEVIEDSDDRRSGWETFITWHGSCYSALELAFSPLCWKDKTCTYHREYLNCETGPFMPYVDLNLGELATKIFPHGMLQFLSGGDDLGPMLTEHPDIDKISFTVSAVTGMNVMKVLQVRLRESRSNLEE